MVTLIGVCIFAPMVSAETTEEMFDKAFDFLRSEEYLLIFKICFFGVSLVYILLIPWWSSPNIDKILLNNVGFLSYSLRDQFVKYHKRGLFTGFIIAFISDKISIYLAKSFCDLPTKEDVDDFMVVLKGKTHLHRVT